MDNATTSVAPLATPDVMTPAATAAPNSTKLNSLPCGRARAKRSALRVGCPASRPRPNEMIVLATSRDTTPSRMGSGCAATRFNCAPMPTDMKKQPSSSPSNGSISACNSCRYSELDSRTPARKAPSDMDRPARLAR